MLRPVAAGLHVVRGTKLGCAEPRLVLSPHGSNRAALLSLPERRKGSGDFSIESVASDYTELQNRRRTSLSSFTIR